MKKLFILIPLALLFWKCSSQNPLYNNKDNFKTNKPKLMVGIVVDQMRFDYLYRFYGKFSNNGFKRLLNNGFVLENVHLNYAPTHTAVGHTSIYTGTTPSIHGIMGNHWYDKNQQKAVYCVDDDNYFTVGATSGGEKSPKKLQVTTVSDQLHLAQIMHGKVIGISMKDRAAILPVGHSANAAYWFSKENGHFITSSYYMNKLPKWVNDFNKRKLPEIYLSKDWETLYNIKNYTESIDDNNNNENNIKGEDDVTFPHTISKIFKEKQNFKLINFTPKGNTLLVDFAKAAILGEKLGQKDYTDFLSISFSATDFIGHTFGVYSKEVEDTYIRLDQDLAELLSFLDKKVGKDKYTLILTSDHGGLPALPYLQKNKIPSLYFDTNNFNKYINKIVKEEFKHSNLIENISNYQIFYNKKALHKNKIKQKKLSNFIIDNIINYKGVYKCFTAKELQNANYNERIIKFTQNGYNQKISGDIIIIPNPGTVSYMKKGTEHSTVYGYDTHIPLIFYGKNIKTGTSNKYIKVIDIAPTLSYLLKIEAPNGNKGNIINEVIK
jgi:hypothetical protein